MASSRKKLTLSQVKAKLVSSFREKAADYRAAVSSGKRRAGMLEKLKIARQDRDLEEGVPGYVWSEEAALRPLLWMALNLRFPSGPTAGRPLLLQPWQIFDIMVLFGWVDEQDPTKRRYNDAFWEIARKNGKSTLAGAILDYLAFGGEMSGARCYIGATSLEQSEEVFMAAADAVRRAKGEEVRVANSKNNKQINFGNSMIRAIAAEPKDGKLAYGTIIDEYHQHKSNDLIESIHSGNVSMMTPMLIRITTAGTNLHGCCHEEYEKCKSILQGDIDVPRYFVSIYEPDQGDDPSDPAIWEKANPNLNVSVDQELLQSQYEYAAQSETDFVAFKTKNLNLWCHGLSKWANMPVWFERCKWEYPEEKLNKRVAYGGLDLAAVSDFTSFTLCFPVDTEEPDGTKRTKDVLLSHFWIPLSQKDQIQRECRIPLDQWIKDGYVTATPGEVIDYSYVADYIIDCQEKYNIPYIAVDKWNISALLSVMPDWFSEKAFEFSQGLKTMSPTIKDFERAYLTGQVSAGGNPVIDWMMSCADVFQDSNGNVKLVKPKRRTSARIDGVITMIMALNTAATQADTAIADEDIENLVSFF